MAEKSTIEWTDTTWNPVTGCTKISVGCDNCYAARFSERFRGVPGHPFENGFDLTRASRIIRPATLDCCTESAGRLTKLRSGRPGA
jgi:protein gp37